MINIAVCDDDSFILSQIKDIVNEFDRNLNINTYENEKILENSNNIDILFMDIEIGSVSGIDIAMQIRKQNLDCIIIFITNYTNYISDVFDVIPFQYLIKPLDEKRIKFTLRKALLSIVNRRKFIEIIWKGNKEVVECKNITYFEILQRNTGIHLKNGCLKKSRIKFIDYVDMLEEYGFVRCHNSIMVNISFIKSLEQYTLYLDNGEIVSISKKYLKNVREAFKKKLSGEIICK